MHACERWVAPSRTKEGCSISSKRLNGSYKRLRRVKSQCKSEWLANGEWRAMEMIGRDAIELQSRLKDSDDGNEGRE